MSKNTREANFRKVDVDELDEEQFRDDAEEEEDQSDQIGQREAEVKKLISRYPPYSVVVRRGYKVHSS